MKKCSICRKEKRLDDFHFSLTRRDQRQHYCKPCRRADTAARYVGKRELS